MPRYDAGASGSLVGEYDGSGNLIQETVWLGDIPVATLRPNGSSVEIYYILTDHLNISREVIRPSDNALMWTWFSGPFGAGAPNENPQGIGTFVYDLRLPGQVAGAWGSTFQNDNRDYDPAVGRYVESDPIGLSAGSYSTYAYVGGNPISHADPLGLCDKKDCEQQAQEDEEVCRSLPNSTSEDKAVRSRCWASVQERFGACSANKPLPPLVTWRNSLPAPILPVPSVRPPAAPPIARPPPVIEEPPIITEPPILIDPIL